MIADHIDFVETLQMLLMQADEDGEHLLAAKLADSLWCAKDVTRRRAMDKPRDADV